MRSIDGTPSIPCKRSGIGKRPAPPMDKEYVKINITGKILNLTVLQILNNPTANTILNNEHNTNPIVKIVCVSVPKAPSSLTNPEK